MKSRNSNAYPANGGADMHFHTTMSDWWATSAEAVARCVRNGVRFAVATEHDVVNREFTALAREAGIRTLEGVEISARANVWNGAKKHLHVTAYAKKFDGALDAILEDTRNGRVRKMKLQCEILRERWFEISHEKFLERFEKSGFDLSNLTNFHLAEYLTEMPGTPDLTKRIMGAEVTNPNDFIKLFLKRESPFPVGVPENFPEYEPETFSVADSVIRKSRGILSVAHPNFTFEKEGTETFENEIMKNLVKDGINGIELNPLASPEWTETVLRVRKRYGLTLTFWSDCHFLPNKIGDWRHSDVGEAHSYFASEETSMRIDKILEAVA